MRTERTRGPDGRGARAELRGTAISGPLRRLLEERHRGAAKAVTGGELLGELRDLGVDVRNLRRIGEAVQVLRLEGVAVASTSQEPAGYFIAQNDGERRAFADETVKRISALSRVLRAFNHKRFEAIQLALGLGGEG